MDSKKFGELRFSTIVKNFTVKGGINNYISIFKHLKPLIICKHLKYLKYEKKSLCDVRQRYESRNRYCLQGKRNCEVREESGLKRYSNTDPTPSDYVYLCKWFKEEITNVSFYYSHVQDKAKREETDRKIFFKKATPNKGYNKKENEGWT